LNSFSLYPDTIIPLIYNYPDEESLHYKKSEAVVREITQKRKLRT